MSIKTLWLNEGRLGPAAEPGGAMSVCSPQTFGSAGGDMCSFAIPGDLPVDCRVDAAGALSSGQNRLTPWSTYLARPCSISPHPRIGSRDSLPRCSPTKRRTAHRTLITRGFANLAHRVSDTAPEPVVPDVEMTVTVPLHGIGYRLCKRAPARRARGNLLLADPLACAGAGHADRHARPFGAGASSPPCRGRSTSRLS